MKQKHCPLVAFGPLVTSECSKIHMHTYIYKFILYNEVLKQVPRLKSNATYLLCINCHVVVGLQSINQVSNHTLEEHPNCKM